MLHNGGSMLHAPRQPRIPYPINLCSLPTLYVDTGNIILHDGKNIWSVPFALLKVCVYLKNIECKMNSVLQKTLPAFHRRSDVIVDIANLTTAQIDGLKTHRPVLTMP